MSRKKRLFTVEMGASLKENGETYHRYTVNGPGGEVMRGARKGKKDDVKRYAQKFADKLNKQEPSQRFVINAA